MILDTLTTAERYAEVHSSFPRAFAFLRQADWARLPGTTRHSIDGDRMFVSVDSAEGRGRDNARLEAHRRYIDIHLTIEGEEEIGWKPLDACVASVEAYDEAKDILFFSDRPDSWLSLPAGHFAIFFPGDAHAPLAGRGSLKKAVMKIAVS